MWRPPPSLKPNPSTALGSVRQPVPHKTPATPKPAKPAHRERLLSAVTDAIADRGYEATTVAEVIAYAGVSRATFYEHFADKDACVLAAYQQAATQITRRFRRAATPAGKASALRPALQALLNTIAANPAQGILLFCAARAAGQIIPAQPQPLLDEITRLTTIGRAATGHPVFDLSSISLLGGITTVISNRLAANAADRLPSVLDDLVGWADAYTLPSRTPPWTTTTQAVLRDLPPLPPTLPTSSISAKPDVLPRGRRKLPDSVVARNHRSRLLHAVAETAVSNGYKATTVAQIAAAANVGRQVFYEHFQDRQHAALQVQRQTLRHAATRVADGYFIDDVWSARIRNTLHYITTLIAQQPALARLAIIEPYAIGQTAVENLKDALLTYAFVFQEGYHQPTQHQPPPQLASEATIGALFETIRHHLLTRPASDLPLQLPTLTYLALAPFLGREHAIEALANSSAH
jgi:AcrR family transcriptional regulator